MSLELARYTSTPFSYPKDDINPDDKNEEWGKAFCECVYARWKQGKTVIPYSKVDEIRSLRDLAEGNQNIIQYQKILLDESEEGSAMEGYMNINWDVFNVMPKFLRIVEGMMTSTDHQVVATAVDPSSTDEREEKKLQMMFRMKFKEQVEAIEKDLGIDNSGAFVPESMEELNIYEGAGGFKLAKEIEIEQGLDYSFYISLWKEIKKKLIYDLCVIGHACAKDYTDPYTKKVKTRYVDPEYFIGECSKHDPRKLIVGGEITKVSIIELRKLLNIPEDELQHLASEYAQINGIQLTNFNYNEDNGTSNYDSVFVDVVDAEWESVNSQYYITRKNQYDNVITYKATKDEWGKVYNTEKKKTSKYDIHVIYKCKWIIGTKYVYDFGLQYDVPRPGKKEVQTSFHHYKIKGRSMVSQSETHLHMLAMTHFKLQNAIAQARPKGLAIEYTALKNMALKGKKKLDPLDLIRISVQTGVVVFQATTHAGKLNIPGGMKPIQELEGGIGPQLLEFIEVFNLCINNIREITGINQVADASQPNPEMLVGVSEMALAATNNALKPIYSAYIHLKEQTAKNMSMRLQLLIKHNKEAYEGYMPVIGRLGVQLISVGADVVDADYFIKYEAKPTDQRRQKILEAATAAMNPDRDGVIGIELPDFLMIERLLEAGSLKYAEAYLNYKSKKNKERQMQLQRENMQIDAQREQELVKAKTAAAEKESQIKVKETLAIHEGKAKIDDFYKEKEHQRKMKELALQSSFKVVEDSAKAQKGEPVTV